MALVALIALPSALRPPNQQPNQTAELSPDAPPDKNQTAIISALNRATSGVATNDEVATTTTTTPPQQAAAPPNAPPPPPRACPGGVGNPPRQVESVYAPGCAAPFQGDNGGETYAGVTGEEIRIGVRGTGTSGGANDCGENGRIDDMDPTGMDAAERTFWVLEKYFNKYFQLYGRRVSFYCIEPASLSIADEQAAAVEAADTFKVFGTPTANAVSCVPLAERKLVSMCDGLLDEFYQSHAPYVWGSYQSATEQIRFHVEQICSMLKDKPASFGGADVAAMTRKFGYVLYGGGRGYEKDADFFKSELKDTCGVDLFVILISSAQDSQEGGAALASAATELKRNGITTVIPGMDFIDLAILTNSAQSQAYTPEWYIGDGGAISRNELGRLQNKTEWQHAFGLTAEEPERPSNQTECWRAYHAIDPANNPNGVICRYEWHSLIQFMALLQLAGPKIT